MLAVPNTANISGHIFLNTESPFPSFGRSVSSFVPFAGKKPPALEAFSSKHFEVKQMRDGAAVVLCFLFAHVCGKGHEPNGFCGYVQRPLDEALMIVQFLKYCLPHSFRILSIDPIMLDEASRKTEPGLIMAPREKEHRGSIEPIRIALHKLPVEITVQHQAEAFHLNQFIKRIDDRLVRLAKVPVIASPNASVQSIQKRGAVAILAG